MAKNNKKKSSKWIIIVAVLLIVAAIVYIKAKPNSNIKVTANNPTIGTIKETIPANGKIKPVTEVKISPDVSGEIVELHFKEGDHVKKGDLIIKIKQDVYISLKDRAIASLNSTKAQYLQQEAELNQQELNYKRNKKLYDTKAISESEYETALSQYEVAKSQLKAAEFNIQSATASVKEAEENLIKTLIYAPMDGVISKLMVEKGERVVGTSQMAGTEMLRIADFDAMEVLVDVNENDIIKINCADTAIIDVDAYPEREFKGIVTQVANSAKNIGSTTEQVTNFEVKILIIINSYADLITDSAFPFRPGMSASVKINTKSKDNILIVPIQAITSRKDLSDGKGENEQFVFVLKDGVVNKRKIVAGIQDLYNIEIVEGLTKDDLIVTSPYSAISKDLKDGDEVEVNEKNAAAKVEESKETK
jgi:HlyD family secretion protein